MKYIRTNDNQIINVGKLKIDYDIKIVGNYLQVFCKFGITPIETYEITKQADTIEELCDVAVIVGKRYDEPYHWWFYRHKDAEKNDLVEIVKDYMEIWRNEYYMVFENIYGAIWTEKGLIYVAKMNEKGELELL